MKSLFFIVLGAVPLAFLTVIAFGAVLFTPSWKPEITVEQFDKIIVTLDGAKRELAPLSNAPDSMAKENLVGSPTPKSLRGMPAEGTVWGQTPEFACLWGDLFSSAKNFLESQRKLESDKVSDMFQIQSDIRSFLAHLDEQRSAQKPVIRHINDLQKEVAVKIERLQKEEEATKILADARNAFDEKKWLVCAKFCKQLQDEYADYTGTAVKANIAMLSNRCEFYLSEEGIDLISETEPASVQKEKLGELLKRVDNPDALSDNQKRQYKQWQQRYDALELSEFGNIVISDATKAKIKSFYDAPSSFSAKVKAADKILASDNSPDVRTALQSEIHKFIIKGVPEKTCPNAKFEYQGKLKDGTVLKGAFVRVRDDDGKVVGYRFFENEAQLNDPDRQDLLYKVEDFSTKPGPTLTNKLVARYNAERAELMENISDRDAWNRFIAKCTELETRRNAEGITDVSFAQPLKAAKMITDPELIGPFQNITK